MDGEKTQGGRGAHQVPAPSPAPAAAAGLFASLSRAARRCRKGPPQLQRRPPEQNSAWEHVYPLHALQREQSTYFTKGPKPKTLILTSTF